MTHASLDATVRGRVQGVGFRYFARRVALEQGLSGWVSNEPDGSVRCVATGPIDGLEAFLDRLRQGPASASVERVDAAWGTPWGDPSGTFEIRSGAHRGD